MIPQVNDSNPDMTRPVDKIAVGNLGTRPVWKKVTMIGIANSIAVKIEINPMAPKKKKGFSSLKSLMINKRIRYPSEKVFNLLLESSCRAL